MCIVHLLKRLALLMENLYSLITMPVPFQKKTAYTSMAYATTTLVIGLQQPKPYSTKAKNSVK